MGAALRECPSLLIARPRSVGQSLRSDGSCLRAIPSVVPGFGMLPDPTRSCEHTRLSVDLCIGRFNYLRTLYHACYKGPYAAYRDCGAGDRKGPLVGTMLSFESNDDWSAVATSHSPLRLCFWYCPPRDPTFGNYQYVWRPRL